MLREDVQNISDRFFKMYQMMESHLHFIALHFKLSQYFGFVLDTPLCPKDITESLPTFRLGQDVLYIK